ncbi:MAG: cell division protein FtsZ [Pseudomonadota bacterium]
MSLNLRVAEFSELTPRIAVFGVGGAGGNAVNNMIDKELEGVEFIAANTDSQALQASRAPRKIQLGASVTQGLGAGARPSLGCSAAEETLDEVIDCLEGAHMAFVTAGMGGGTGTGAAPVIARAAREMGILTVGVVTKPFEFEGVKRMRIAEGGIEDLQQYVDTLIVIPNQNLFRVANERTTFAEAFMLADDVLYQGVKGVTDLMVRPGIVNLDFADVRAVMSEMGKAMMGSGEAMGEERAREAAEKAIANPLLDEVSLRGARGVLINITGGLDLTLFEVDEAANRIRSEVDPEASVFFGSALDPEMEGKIRVSVVATGIDAEIIHGSRLDEAQRSEMAARQGGDGGRGAGFQRGAVKRAVAQHQAARPATVPVVDAPEPAVTAKPASPTLDQLEIDAGSYEAAAYRARSADTATGSARTTEGSEDLGFEETRGFGDETGFHEPVYDHAPDATEESFIPPRAARPGSSSEAATASASSAVKASRPENAMPPSAPVSSETEAFVRRVSGAATAEPTEVASAEPQRRRRADEEDNRVQIPSFLRRQAN